jgi:hypothetical protein
MLSTKFFIDIRPRFVARRKGYSKSLVQKFYAILWVVQEILKTVPTDAPWEQGLNRKGLPELQWDEASIRSDTEENSRLIFQHHPQIKKLESLLSANKEPPLPPREHRLELRSEGTVEESSHKSQGIFKRFRKMLIRLFRICKPETVQELISEKEKT